MKIVAKAFNWISGKLKTGIFLMRNCNEKWCLWRFNIDPNKETFERIF